MHDDDGHSTKDWARDTVWRAITSEHWPREITPETYDSYGREFLSALTVLSWRKLGDSPTDGKIIRKREWDRLRCRATRAEMATKKRTLVYKAIRALAGQ
jgi:hypothetical protein